MYGKFTLLHVMYIFLDDVVTPYLACFPPTPPKFPYLPIRRTIFQELPLQSQGRALVKQSQKLETRNAVSLMEMLNLGRRLVFLKVPQVAGEMLPSHRAPR